MLLSMIALSGCGSAAIASPRLALMPAAWRTSDPWPELEERDALRRGLRDVRTVDASCEGEDCAREAGRAVDADRVVVTTMASLGETVLARVSVIDLEGEAEEETRQRVIEDASAARVESAMTDLGRSIAEPYLPRGAPWYEEWWPWTIGAVLVLGIGAAIAGGVVAGQRRIDSVIEFP